MAKKGLANTPASRSRPHVVENAYRKVHGRGLIATLGAQNNPAAVATPAYDDLTREQLRDEAEKRGLAKSGSKADLKARLEEYDG